MNIRVYNKIIHSWKALIFLHFRNKTIVTFEIKNQTNRMMHCNT